MGGYVTTTVFNIFFWVSTKSHKIFFHEHFNNDIHIFRFYRALLYTPPSLLPPDAGPAGPVPGPHGPAGLVPELPSPDPGRGAPHRVARIRWELRYPRLRGGFKLIRDQLFAPSTQSHIVTIHRSPILSYFLIQLEHSFFLKPPHGFYSKFG